MGPITEWPQSIVTAINIALHSTVPIVMLFGEDGIMVYNDAYSVFAAGRHPSLLGSKVVEGWPEVADFNRNVMKVGLAGKTLEYIDQKLTLYRNNRPEEVWMNLNYSPIIGESGKPCGVLAIVIETTQQIVAMQHEKEAEKALHAEREQLRVLLRQAPAAIAVLEGPEHRYSLANMLYQKIFNRTEKALLGKSVQEAFPEVTGQGIYELLDNVFATGTPAIINEFPATFRRSKGAETETGYFSFVAQPIQGVEGNVQSILIHAVEVTAQVSARRKIENIATLNKTITNNVTTGLLILDNGHFCTFMNPAAEKIIGLTLKLIKRTGKPLHDIVHHTKPDGSPYPINECSVVTNLPTTHTVSGKEVFIKPDGTFYPVSFTASAIMEDNTAIGTLIEIRDITIELQAQKEQQQLVSLTNQRNELIKLNQAKDEFIALASHQLRTPATAVKQYVSLLINGYAGELASDQLTFLQTAYDSNERQLNIINDLLKTAQLDSNRFVLTKQRVPITGIIRDAIKDMQSSLALKDQQVIFKGEADTTKVEIDENEVRLALVNLLENASKYSYNNTLITVQLRKRKQHIEVSITDEGVGITPENKQKIFEKFTRINNDLSDTVTGSGLGLYWIKRIIKLHGGTVKVHSALGKGSTFTISLPI